MTGSFENIFKKASQRLIKLYQIFVSPLVASRCRFFPSCSEYSYECFERYSFCSAIYKTIIRIIKCNPFHSGGVDLP